MEWKSDLETIKITLRKNWQNGKISWRWYQANLTKYTDEYNSGISLSTILQSIKKESGKAFYKSGEIQNDK